MTFLQNNSVPSLRRLLRSRGMKRLLKAMSALPEPKQEGKTKHPTWRCLLTLLLSLTRGGNYVLDAASFAKRNEARLSRLFGEGYSAPSYCTLVRAVHKIGPHALLLIRALGFAKGGRGGFQMDGKLVRATRDSARDNSAVDVLELTLGPGFSDFEPCGPGSKEKSEKAAMARLAERNAKALREGVLTADAIAADTVLTGLLARLRIRFCVCVKNEGRGLGDAIASDFLARRGELKPIVRAEKKGGRIDRWEYFFIEDPSEAWAVYGKRRWGGVAHIGAAARRTVNAKTGKASAQTRYYLLSEGVDHRSFAEARSLHWGIEAAHWQIDNSFLEDRRRIGGKDHPAAFAMAVLTRKAFEAIRSSLTAGMDFSKARRELHEMGFRELLYVISGKAATATAKNARSDQKK